MLNIIISNLNYIALAFALMLSGCYQTVNKYDMDRAAKHCGGTEHVVEINLHFQGSETVLCSNGQWKDMSGLPAK